MKQCSKCKIDKSFQDFYERKGSRIGYRPECKVCSSIYSKERAKIYYAKNKEKILSRNEKYVESNNEKINEYRKEYRQKNKEKTKQYTEEYKMKKNETRKKRFHMDYLFRITVKLRTMIRKSLIDRGYTKKSKTQEILGCSFVEFKNYLESKFENWMDWKNRGLYNGDFNYGWDIDHIIPISSATTEEELIKLNHYTNLQPLCSKVNRDIKKDKIEYGKFRSLHNN